MIYSINLFMCAIGTLLFKNALSFILLSLVVILIFYFFIRKLSEVTVILFFLNIIAIFIGGLVIWLLPNKEGIIPSIIVNAYYLGPIEIVLFIAFLVSTIFDVKCLISEKNKKKDTIKKEKIKALKEEQSIKNKEFKEKVDKLEKTINDSNEEIKKIVEGEAKEKTKKKVASKKKVANKVTEKKVKTVKKTIKKEK